MTAETFAKKYWPHLAVAIITLAGFLLRMYQLTWQCLNVDEVTTQWIADHTVEWIIHYSLSIDYNPPLYYLVTHYSFVLFNDISIFTLRFPAVVFGTLAIPVAYLVAWEIRGKTLGLLVAGLMSFMFPFYYYSQDARAYSMVLLAFMGFSYFFVRMYNGDRSKGMIASISICAALCLWSHYYSAVPVAVMLLILFVKDRVSTIYSIAITSALLSPMVALFDYSQITVRTTHVGNQAYAWATPLETAIMLPNELLCWSWIVLVPLAVYSYIKTKDKIIRDLLIVSLITALLLIPISQFTGTSPRYALLISPLILFAAMYPVADWIDNLNSNLKKTIVFALVLFVIFILNYGSLVEWTTFNICPFMTSNGAAAGG